MEPLIDVLLCTYNEAPHLPRALESLRRQTAGADAFRVILVDNASSDDTRTVVDRHAKGLNLEYVVEPRLGLNFARCTGYAHARAEYVAHIDADAKADPRWIETILEVLREERPDLCGGPYFPYYVDPKPRWYLDRYNSDGRGDEARALGEGEFVNGTNMIWRRERVEQLGGFRGDLGVTARGAARGGETNLIIRGRQEIAGFKVWYHPGMIVYHLTRPGAMSLGYSIRQLFATGRKHNQVFNITKHDLSRPRLFLRLLQTAGRLVGLALGALLYRDRKRFPFWQNAVYERMLPEFYRLGRLWEGVVHWRSSCAGIARQDPANVGSSECRATVASRSPSCS